MNHNGLIIQWISDKLVHNQKLLTSIQLANMDHFAVCSKPGSLPVRHDDRWRLPRSATAGYAWAIAGFIPFIYWLSNDVLSFIFMTIP